jgi:hypothetical protein
MMDRPMKDGEQPQFRRELTQDDLVRARIPVRYWKVNLGGVQEQVRGIADKYLKEIGQMHERGVGLLLWGANGIGKTSLAVVLGKEYRRRGHSLLFLESAELKGAIIHNEAFDEEHTLWDRAKSVDVLLYCLHTSHRLAFHNIILLWTLWHW